MAVKLRLMRMGKKKQPTYRVVAADSRAPRNGRFIEIIGFYEPRQEPSVVRIDNDRALHWLRHGAQPTERVEKLLKISGAWESFRGHGSASDAAGAVPKPQTSAEPAQTAAPTDAAAAAAAPKDAAAAAAAPKDAAASTDDVVAAAAPPEAEVVSGEADTVDPDETKADS